MIDRPEEEADSVLSTKILFGVIPRSGCST